MRFCLIAILLFTVVVLFAQDHYPPVINYTPRQYGMHHNSEIYAVIQDKRGVMYFGTANGIFEFDGQKWNFIEVPLGGYTRSLGLDSSGVVCVGSFGEFGYLTTDATGKVVPAKNLPDRLQQIPKFTFK